MEYNKKLVVHTCDSDVKLAICISGAQSFGRFEWAVQPHKGEVGSVISYHGFLWVLTFVYSNGPCYLLLTIVGRFYEHAISWQHLRCSIRNRVHNSCSWCSTQNKLQTAVIFLSEYRVQCCWNCFPSLVITARCLQGDIPCAETWSIFRTRWTVLDR
jgi:hypothetical protein